MQLLNMLKIFVLINFNLLRTFSILFRNKIRWRIRRLLWRGLKRRLFCRRYLRIYRFCMLVWISVWGRSQSHIWSILLGIVVQISFSYWDLYSFATISSLLWEYQKLPAISSLSSHSSKTNHTKPKSKRWVI